MNKTLDPLAFDRLSDKKCILLAGSLCVARHQVQLGSGVNILYGLMVSTWKPPCWVIRCHFPGQGNFKHTISHNVSALGKPRHKDTEDPREMTSMGLATIEHCRRREGINLPSKLANRTTKEQNGFNRFYIVLRSVPNKTT